jgi:hypothetical protein
MSRENLVLTVVGEIFGCMKNNGAPPSSDPAALLQWLRANSLVRQLLQVAHPELKVGAHEAMPSEDARLHIVPLREFEDRISDVINPKES